MMPALSLPRPLAEAARPPRAAARFVWRIVQRYLESDTGNWATLIAWNFLFAFFPLVLIAASVLGLLLRNPGIALQINTAVASTFHTDQQGIFKALNTVQQRSGLFALVGVVGLFWSGTSLFAVIDQGLSRIYGCKPRDFLPQRLMGLGMVLLLTVLTVPILLSATLLPLVRHLPLPSESYITSGAAYVTQALASIADGTVLFGAIYLIVPNRRQRARHVLPGALTAGALFTLFSLVFPVYIAHFASGFERFGATFAIFFIILTYFFFIGQITMIGGLVAVECDPERDRCRAGSADAPAAVGEPNPEVPAAGGAAPPQPPSTAVTPPRPVAAGHLPE
ncbi:MAG: YihY/virulence factor BrkB family protein [Candidatus Dormibacteria bacterium]